MTIMINNLPVNVPHSELKDFLNNIGFQVEKIKPMKERIDKSKTTEYVRLEGGEAVEWRAIEVLNGKTWKGKQLSALPDSTYHPDVPDQPESIGTPAGSSDRNNP